MEENNRIFELVLYFTRRVTVKPTEPKFETIKKYNPNLDDDSLLDIFSDLKNKYEKNLEKYEKNKNESTITDFVLIIENEDFYNKIKEFEKNDFFLNWTSNSKRLIDETLVRFTK
jgi:hypothetical protein